MVLERRGRVADTRRSPEISELERPRELVDSLETETVGGGVVSTGMTGVVPKNSRAASDSKPFVNVMERRRLPRRSCLELSTSERSGEEEDSLLLEIDTADGSRVISSARRFTSIEKGVSSTIDDVISLISSLINNWQTP
mmetsp:Transcript_3314/g.5218  ORF Transcript_3314/g.5218 Transcript_3314/m.5218 type:complete len:140 (-) Transcript_3314:161-580(-)